MKTKASEGNKVNANANANVRLFCSSKKWNNSIIIKPELCHLHVHILFGNMYSKFHWIILNVFLFMARG